MAKKEQFTLSNGFYEGTIQGQNIAPNEIDYYEKNSLSSLFDLNSLTFEELSAITGNLIQQAKETFSQLSIMSNTDEDIHYWLDDYENEKATYLELKTAFKKFDVDLPDLTETLTEESQEIFSSDY